MKLPNRAHIQARGGIDRSSDQLVPHSLAFPSAMVSLKLLLGLPHRTHPLEMHGMRWRADEDYYDFIGLSGEGFGFLFDTAEYFRFGLPSGAQPVADCFAAIGTPCEIFSAHPVAGMRACLTDEADVQQRTLTNLADGYPALLLGRTQMDRVLLATGYEDDGETLVAWTFTPGSDMTNKSFDVQDCQYIEGWRQGVDALVLVRGKPGPVGDPAAIHRRALARGERMLREGKGHPYGEWEDCYAGWIGRLRDAAFWQAAFGGRPYIDPEIWDLAERRAFCGGYLWQAGEALGTQALYPAAEAFESIHMRMWELNALCDGGGAADKLRDAKVREQIIAILTQCRALEVRAADAIAQALSSGGRGQP